MRWRNIRTVVAVAKSDPSQQGCISWLNSALLASRRTPGPALLFGLRLWAAVCIALYISYKLELGDAYWAGWSAAITFQPSLGASLRKASFRIVGTVVGAVAIIILSACFPQDRAGFLLGLALWGAACGFVAAVLPDFANYGATLAGYTAVIIASDALGAAGGAGGGVFTLAITRVSEISIGIICAGAVLAGTDFGGARGRLTTQLATLAAEIASRLGDTFSSIGPDQANTRRMRRDILARVIELNLAVDEAVGENSNLRYRAPALRTAVNGLLAALSGWGTVANRLGRSQNREGRREAHIIQQTLPQELRLLSAQGNSSSSMDDPWHLRLVYQAALRALVVLPIDTPSLRLLADGTAETLLGLSQALAGLTLLANPAHAVPLRGTTRFHLPDLLPPLINAARIFSTIAAVELFWVATAWPNGATAMMGASLGVILWGQAFGGAMIFASSIIVATVLAAIASFAVLPAIETFAGFSAVIGLVLVPLGALSAQPWRGTMFGTMAALFIVLLAPTNQMTYDTAQFCNSSVAIITGVCFAALTMLLVPPLSPTVRNRRVLAFTLNELRRLAAGRIHPLAADWRGRACYHVSRLSAQIEPSQLARLVAAISVGAEIIKLRRMARRFDIGPDLAAALDAVAEGESGEAIRSLAQIDCSLAAFPDVGRCAVARLRARGGILAISEALAQHRAYFDSGGPR